MLTALATASAYDETCTAHGSEAPPAMERRMLVLVRQGSAFQIHGLDAMAMRPSGAGETTIVEDVASGDIVCEGLAFNEPLPLSGTYTWGWPPSLGDRLEPCQRPAPGDAGRCPSRERRCRRLDGAAGGDAGGPGVEQESKRPAG